MTRFPMHESTVTILQHTLLTTYSEIVLYPMLPSQVCSPWMCMIFLQISVLNIRTSTFFKLVAQLSPVFPQPDIVPICE